MPSWLIIGATRGIGLEFVRQLSANPDNVVFGTARDLNKAAKLVELAKTRPNAHAITADFVSLKSLQGAAKEVAKVTGGSLDVLVNNGAYLVAARNSLPPSYYESHLDEIEFDYMEHFRVNALGPVFAIHAFLPLLRKGQVKKIINVSSALGDLDLSLAGLYQGVPYSVSKAALNMVTVKYAAELKSEGFSIAAIHPGMVPADDFAEHEMSPEEANGVGLMIAKLKELYPGMKNNGMIEVEHSVRKQVDTINALTVENTGAWVSYTGDKSWVEQ